MQTRRDHVQAYQFAMSQLGTALVTGEPGVRGESPTRRPMLGTFFGVALVVLLCIGFAVYGLLVPGGNTSWRKAGSIIVEEETGNRYLYLDGELRPARNYASALLLAGNQAEVRSVSRNSLDGVPHGAPVGIPDAPDSLPPAKNLLSGAWMRCLNSDAPSGQVLDFGPEGRTRDIPDDRLILLTSPDDDVYLHWRGTKYPVPGAAALTALGLDGEPLLPAPDDWLAALPTGAELTAPRVPGAGRLGRAVAGQATGAGQLFRTTVAEADYYYVMREEGIEPVSLTQAALLGGRPGASPVRPVRPADIAEVPESGADPLPELPDVLGVRPARVAAEDVCLWQKPDGTKLRSRVVALRADADPPAAGSAAILPGHAVLAVNQDRLSAGRSAKESGARPYLITELGVLHPLTNTESVATLGYGEADPLPLPEGVLELLSRGPELGVAAARAAAGGG